jgi:putative ABC transport system ATP-binding protein
MMLLFALNDAGCTVVIITHEEEVAGFTNRVVRLRDGRIVNDEVKREPTQASA